MDDRLQRQNSTPGTAAASRVRSTSRRRRLNADCGSKRGWRVRVQWTRQGDLDGLQITAVTCVTSIYLSPTGCKLSWAHAASNLRAFYRFLCSDGADAGIHTYIYIYIYNGHDELEPLQSIVSYSEQHRSMMFCKTKHDLISNSVLFDRIRLMREKHLYNC